MNSEQPNIKFDKETVEKALNDQETMDKLVLRTQVFFVSSYFDQVMKEKNAGIKAIGDDDDIDNDELLRDAKICPDCEQLTLYSTKVAMPQYPFDDLCLSAACIENAVRFMGQHNDTLMG